MYFKAFANDLKSKIFLIFFHSVNNRFTENSKKNQKWQLENFQFLAKRIIIRNQNESSSSVHLWLNLTRMQI